MKTVQIVHNPTAGNAMHSRNDLVDSFRKSGHNINYLSTDWENWEEMFDRAADYIFVAGGDGTIHKTAAALLKVKQKIYPPIKLLPLGTANNIAETLRVLKASLHSGSTGKAFGRFDCGRIKGMKEKEFFLESVGFGVFPKLIAEMEKNPIETGSAGEKIKKILKVLVEIVKDFKAHKAKIKVNGISIKGAFLMLEVMNIKHVGPNLELAPQADPGDGYLDLVMVPESSRSQLLAYLEKMIRNEHSSSEVHEFAKYVRVQKMKMKWYGEHLHIDDTLFGDYSQKNIKIEMLPGAMAFIEKIPPSDPGAQKREN